VVVVIIAWTTIELLDPDESPESWLLLKLFHPGPFNFTVNVDLKVDGQPVHLDRVIQCKPKFTSRITGRLRAAWYSSRSMISEKLSSGAGVMIVLPDVCDYLEIVPADFVPVIMWTADANNPDVIESYFDPASLRRGLGHIKFVKMTVTWPSDSQVEEYQIDFIDLFGNVGMNPPPKGIARRYVGYFAYEIPKEYWSKYAPELTGPVSNAPEVFLPGRDRDQLHSKLSIDVTDLLYTLDGPYFPKTKAWGGGRIHELPPAEVLPFEKAGSGLQIDETQRGTIIFYSASAMCGVDLTYIAHKERKCGVSPFPEVSVIFLLTKESSVKNAERVASQRFLGGLK
jgi:hypothetical protein